MYVVLLYGVLALGLSEADSFLLGRCGRVQRGSRISMLSTPSSPRSDRERSEDLVNGGIAGVGEGIIPMAATVAALSSGPGPAAAFGPENVPRADERDDMSKGLSLPDEAYIELGGMRSCRILNGMWQVSGAHGYSPVQEKVVSEMARCADAGFQTFDLADIYGPAEGYVGDFIKGPRASPSAKVCKFYTKWVTGNNPNIEYNRAVTTEAIGRSLRKMNADRLDLLQFHWWDYDNKQYFNAMSELMHLQQDDRIRNLGLCNFDTKHMVDLMDQNAPIISNQVSFSILDDRPLKVMIPECKKRNVQLLVYGTLLGGFLTDKWLGQPQPSAENLTNVSLRKYLPWIRIWGGWDKFQQLLMELNTIAIKHQVSIANVATRWVLQQESVGGVILGVRFGLTEHNKNNAKTFGFKLDDDDMARIEDAKKGTRNLYTAFGDCGGEYRRRG